MNRCILFLSLTSLLAANPTDPQVMNGDALFLNNGQILEIHASDNSIIHWKDFSINSNEIAQFLQPSKDSAVLNRVTGGNMSQIFGQLQSNGKVYLINPSGIVFGEDARIDAGSFIASTLDALDEDFLKGGDIAFQGGLSGTMVNLGTIRAKDGDVFLIAHQVENRGIIEAPNGIACLAAGFEVLLQPGGKEKLFIRPSSQEGASVDQSGEITAIQTEIKANGNPYEFAIRQSGKINAKGIENRNGRVFLVAEKGIVEQKGSINAQNTDGTGGEVHVLGQNVWLSGGDIDVSGNLGGGTVLIGGDFQGENPAIYNARKTVVDRGPVVRADALISGDGGRVIIWSEENTVFRGDVSAKGGPLRGDGGFVEVSGGQLAYRGTVTTRALKGKPGTLLLDPGDVTINGVASNPAYPTTPGPPTDFYNPAAGPGDLDVADIINSLDVLGNDVVVQTSAGAFGTGVITVLADVLWTSGTSLSLQADDSIYVAASILNSSTGAVTLTAANDIRVGLDNTLAVAGQKVMVGSYDGATTLTTTAGQITIGDFVSMFPSQVGYGDISTGSAMTGPIVINAATGGTGVGNVVLNGGNDMANRVFAQVGHGEVATAVLGTTMFDGANATIDITANGGGNVTLAAGTSNESYVQIGHGGAFLANPTANDIGGTINVTSTAGSLTLDGGIGAGTSCVARIGHGGIGDGTTVNSAAFSGDIIITSGSDVSLLGGGVDFNLVQIGHGISSTAVPLAATTNGISGDITITGDTGGLAFVGGSFDRDTCRVGHGGHNFFNIANPVSGHITLTATLGPLAVTGGLGGTSSSVIGHGGVFDGMAPFTANTMNTSGTIAITTAGDIDLIGGMALSSHAQVGHGQDSSLFSGLQGAISLTSSAGRIHLEGGASGQCYAQVGHGGIIVSNTTNPINGMITVEATAGIIELIGGPALVSWARIGHGGFASQITVSTEPISDPIIVHAGSNITMLGGSLIFNFVQIGHGLSAPVDTGPARTNGINGDITVTSDTGFLSFQGGLGPACFSQVGHGGFNFHNDIANVFGDITLLAPMGSLTIEGGAGPSAIPRPSPAIIGHGGASNVVAPMSITANTMNTSGMITISVMGDINLTGGQTAATLGNRAQIGHGQNDSVFNGLQGNISVTSTGGSIFVDAGPGTVNYSHIGHGAYGLINLVNDITGATSVNAPNGTIFVRADPNPSVAFNYALIGHGGDTVTNAVQTLGAIGVAAGGQIRLEGGGAPANWAQIGHGGQGFNSTLEVNGAISVTGSTYLILGGAEAEVPARIGHGGNNCIFAPTAQAVGDITLTATGMGIIIGGAGLATLNSNAQAQIGHIGNNANFTSLGACASGSITVSVPNGFLTLLGGEGPEGCQAQIGHGGFGGTGTIDGIISGNMVVDVPIGAITLTGGAGSVVSGTQYNIADIGHSFFNVPAVNAGTIAGTTSITGGTLTLNGGTSDSNGAYIRSDGGALTIDVLAGDLVMLSGNFPDCSTQISNGVVGASQSITVASGNLTVSAGGSTGCSSEIASSGPQTINVTQGSISLNGGMGLSCVAQVTSLTGFPQTISCLGNLTFQGGLGIGSSARLIHTIAGTQTITVQGDLQAFAGSANGSTARILSTGPLVLTVGGSATFIGSIAMANADIQTTGSQTIDIGQNLTLQAGSGATANAGIACTSTQSITLGGDLHAIGGPGPGIAIAGIRTTAGNDSTITSTGGSVIFRNGTPQTNGAYLQSIVTPPVFSGAGTTINAAGDIAIANDLTSDRHIIFNANSTGSGQGAFLIDTRPYPSFAGVPGPAVNGITLTTTTGDLTLRAASKFADGTPADFVISTPLDLSYLPIQPCLLVSTSGNILVDPFHDVTINTAISTLGDITILADNDMILTAIASITSANTTLVVDEQGLGGLIGGIWDATGGDFILDLGATVIGTSTLRIFTAVRTNNTIDGPTALNGVQFAPGTLFVDTSTEQWFTFFGGPNSTSKSPIYTVYYKNFPPSQFVPFLTTASAELFTMCEPYDNLLRWSLNFSEILPDQSYYPYTINRRIHAEQHNPKTDRVKKWDE